MMTNKDFKLARLLLGFTQARLANEFEQTDKNISTLENYTPVMSKKTEYAMRYLLHINRELTRYDRIVRKGYEIIKNGKKEEINVFEN